VKGDVKEFLSEKLRKNGVAVCNSVSGYVVYILIRVESHWLANRYLITYGTDSDLTRKVGRGRIVNSSLEY
jgi:hypothetical protein